MSDSKNAELVIVTEMSIEERIRDFSILIEKIDNLDSQKRSLWKGIYENAIIDRQNAYVLFTKLYKIIDEASDPSSQFAIHGKTISGYIERMAKANDQLVKLADLVSRAEAIAQNINPDDMFAQISGGR
jgi:hypothetical protein